ncbi:hypothetical protein [Streptomyces sp. NPDC048603]|uniref:hypothetical protein n=1 Tax=Streptomyces sp. NPDC048603 TaxID=3365577 RepID=UPI00372269B3
MRSDAWSEFSARCAELLDALPLPAGTPVTVDVLRTAIEQHRGRPLVLSPLPERAGATAGLCGLWIALGDADHIFYETSTSPLHQQHIILHEIAHLLLDHGNTDGDSSGEGPGEGPGDGAAEGPGGGWGAGITALFPGLDPAMVSRLLARGRTDYTEIQERQAELMATLIHHRTTARPAGPPADPAAAHVLDRLARLFGGGAR